MGKIRNHRCIQHAEKILKMYAEGRDHEQIERILLKEDVSIPANTIRRWLYSLGATYGANRADAAEHARCILTDRNFARTQSYIERGRMRAAKKSDRAESMDFEKSSDTLTGNVAADKVTSHLQIPGKIQFLPEDFKRRAVS